MLISDYLDICDPVLTFDRFMEEFELEKDLESIHGALLRMNRSIQAEGTFGIMKNDRWCKRIVRRCLNSIRLEVFLVSIGQNL